MFCMGLVCFVLLGVGLHCFLFLLPWLCLGGCVSIVVLVVA